MRSSKARAASTAPVLLAILTLTFTFLSAYATPLTHTWSARYGDAGNQVTVDASWDPTGAIITTGHFQDTLSFGGNTLASAGGWDVYLAKLDDSGGHIWSNSYGSTGDQFVTGMDVDVVGNVVICGIFYGSIDFGGGVLTSAGDIDFFVAKFRFDGVHQWSMRFGDGVRQRFGNANPVVAFDGIGDVVMTGELNGTVDFGGGSLVGPAANITGKVFLAKFNSGGSHSWSFLLDVLGGSLSVTTDDSANVIIGVKQITGQVPDYGGGPLSGSGILGMAKYTRSGAHIWSNVYSGGRARELEVDAFGRIVMAGDAFQSGFYDVGGSLLWGLGTIFVARYDSNGNHLASAAYGSSNIVNGNVVAALTTDLSGNIIIGGIASSDWGGPAPGGGPCAALACYDSAGVFQWNQRFCGVAGAVTGVDYLDGSIASGGHFDGAPLDLGGGPLSNAGSNDIFVARFGDESTGIDPGAPIWASRLSIAPDPFARATNIFYNIVEPGPVSITLFDIKGAVVARPYQSKYSSAGDHVLPISLGHLASGVYFVQIRSANLSESKRITLVR